MSAEATTPLPGPASLGQVLGQVAAEVAAAREGTERARQFFAAALRQVSAAADRDPGRADAADLAAAGRFLLTEEIVKGRRLAELREELRTAAAREGVAAILGEALPAPAPAPGPETARQPARHRAARRPARGHLRPVRGQDAAPAILPAAAVLGVIKGTLRHAWAAHPLATAGAAASTAVLAGAITLAPPARTLEFRGAAVPPPSLHLQDAAPVSSASPPPAATVLGRQHHRYQPRHARPPVVVAAPDPEPSRSTAPSPSPSPAASGVLVVQEQSLTIGPARTGLITLIAEGGPVLWSASSSSPDVSLDAAHGGIPAGGTAVIQVTVDPAAMYAAGSAAVTIGDARVLVRWGG